MTEIQAAAGFLVLKRIDKLNSLRIQRAKKFINEMRNFKFLNFIKVSKILDMFIIYWFAEY